MWNGDMGTCRDLRCRSRSMSRRYCPRWRRSMRGSPSSCQEQVFLLLWSYAARSRHGQSHVDNNSICIFSGAYVEVVRVHLIPFQFHHFFFLLLRQIMALDLALSNFFLTCNCMDFRFPVEGCYEGAAQKLRAVQR